MVRTNQQKKDVMVMVVLGSTGADSVPADMQEG
jgi:hypothetical protein